MRWAIIPAVVVSAALLAAAALLVLPTPLVAAPKAKDAGECFIFADLALNAAAHAKHGVSRATFDAIAADIYDLNTDEARELARHIVDAAWRAAEAGAVPGDFATILMRVCRMRGGNMDSILGVSL